MVIRGTLTADGALVQVKLKKVVKLTADQVLIMLAAHKWRFDAADPAPITVGIEEARLLIL